MSTSQFKVSVGVDLEKTGVQAQLDKLKGLKIKVEPDVDVTSIKQKIEGSKNLDVKVHAKFDQSSFKANVRDHIAQSKDVDVKVGVRFDQSEFKSKVREKINNSKNISVKVGAKLDTDDIAKIKTKLEKQIADIDVRATIKSIDTKDNTLEVSRVVAKEVDTTDGKVVLPKATVAQLTTTDGNIVVPKATVSQIVATDNDIVIPKALVKELMSADGSVVIPTAKIQELTSLDGKVNIPEAVATKMSVIDKSVEVPNVVATNVTTNGRQEIDVTANVTSINDSSGYETGGRYINTGKDQWTSTISKMMDEGNLSQSGTIFKELDKVAKEHLKGNPDLAATNTNIMGLYNKAFEQLTKVAKMDPGKDIEGIAEVYKQAFQKIKEGDALFAKYEAKYESDLAKLKSEIDAAQKESSKIEDSKVYSKEEKDNLKAEQDKIIDSKNDEVNKLKKEMEQLKTNVNRGILKSQEDIAVWDAKEQDAKAWQERTQRVNAYNDALKEVADQSAKVRELTAKGGEDGKLVAAEKNLAEAQAKLKDAKASIDFEFNESEANKIERTVDSIKTKMREVDGKVIDIETKSDAKETQSQLDQLIKKEKELNNQKIKLAGLNETSKDFDEAKTACDKLEAEVNQLKQSLGGVSIESGSKGVLNKEQWARYTDEVEKAANKTKEAYRIIAENATGDVDQFGDHTTNLKSLMAQLEKIPSASRTANAAIDSFANSYANLITATREYSSACSTYGKDSQQAAEAARKVEVAQEDVARAYKNAANAVKQNKEAYARAAGQEGFVQNLKSSLLTMDVWAKKNSKVMNGASAEARELAAEYERLRQKMAACNNATDLSAVNKEFGDFKKKVELAGLSGESTIDKLKNKFKEYAVYAAASVGIMEVMQALRQMASETLAVDTAMTGLLRVTEMSGDKTVQMYDKMVNSAKEYGRTLTDTINATTDWVRAGFDDDTALGLAEVTAMYQNVSDLDYDEASENLLTSYNGFKDQLSSDFGGDTVAAVEHITDVLNELDKSKLSIRNYIG